MKTISTREKPRRSEGRRQRGKGENLTYGIVEDLGIAIITGRYGDSFPVEADLCQQYGVSRSILREAVKMLTAKGLLGARPRQGTWVQPEDSWNLLDPDVLRWLLERKLSFSLLIEFTEMRLAVEPIAARIAAEKASPEAKAKLCTALARMEAAQRGEDDALASDIAFHIGLLRACGNRFYGQLCELINTALHFSIRTSNRIKGVETANIQDHRRVLDAILNGDGDGAEKALRSLIQEALDLIRIAGRESLGPGKARQRR
ncbi:MAG TPA: FadR/GntR family transcriptional regulator [Rhizomicrobium sp.]